jgi:hypothetical protein
MEISLKIRPDVVLRCMLCKAIELSMFFFVEKNYGRFAEQPKISLG